MNLINRSIISTTIRRFVLMGEKSAKSNLIYNTCLMIMTCNRLQPVATGESMLMTLDKMVWMMDYMLNSMVDGNGTLDWRVNGLHSDLNSVLNDRFKDELHSVWTVIWTADWMLNYTIDWIWIIWDFEQWIERCIERWITC